MYCTEIFELLVGQNCTQNLTNVKFGSYNRRLHSQLKWPETETIPVKKRINFSYQESQSRVGLMKAFFHLSRIYTSLFSTNGTRMGRV